MAPEANSPAAAPGSGAFAAWYAASGVHAALPGYSAPLIDWSGNAFAGTSGAEPQRRQSAAWMDDFANHLGRSEAERNPNANLRIEVPQSVMQAAAKAAKRLSELLG